MGRSASLRRPTTQTLGSMKTDKEIINLIEQEFGAVSRPDHFLDFNHCEECAEHDHLLCTRDRETLKIEDVGNISWTPLSMCSPEGFAYYMPSLARLALSEPTYEYGWFPDTLTIHLSSNEEKNNFLLYCTNSQKDAVAKLLKYLNISRQALPERLTEPEDFESLINLWKA